MVFIKNKFNITLTYFVLTCIFTYYWFRVIDPEYKLIKTPISSTISTSLLAFIIMYLWLKWIDSDE